MDYQATEKLQLNAGVVYNKSEDSWDWDFSERAPMLREAYIDADDNLVAASVLKDVGVESGPLAAVNYDDYALNNQIDSYSDLEYEQYEFTLGATYHFTDAFYTNVSGTYNIFESDEEYVYGDEDGKSYSGYLAFGYKF